MEILIVGILIVGLMVYASTKIKRSAADAFQAETIESDEFCLTKPAGFLHVLNGSSEFLFEAYSKDFGKGDENRFREANVWLRRQSGMSADEFITNAADLSVTGDISEVVGDHHYRIVEGRLDGDIPLDEHYKMSSCGDELFVFEVRSLPGIDEDLTRKIESMIVSFELR